MTRETIHDAESRRLGAFAAGAFVTACVILVLMCIARTAEVLR